jgi:hypothetical protein
MRAQTLLIHFSLPQVKKNLSVFGVVAVRELNIVRLSCRVSPVAWDRFFLESIVFQEWGNNGQPFVDEGFKRLPIDAAVNQRPAN